MSSKSPEISKEEILKLFPALVKFKDNENILRAMYRNQNIKHDMSGLTDRVNVDSAEVLIASLIGVGDYNGCPDCCSKLNGEVGTVVICTNTRRTCQGASKVITKLYRYRFLAGDNSNTVFIDFLPFGFKLKDRTEAEGLVGKVVKISGYVNGTTDSRQYGKTFNIVVKALKVLDDIKKTDSGALEAFHPTPSTPVTATPTPTIAPEAISKLRLWFKAMAGSVSEDKLRDYLPKISVDFDTLTKSGIVSLNSDGKYVIKAE